jgi:Predicted membrane protein
LGINWNYLLEFVKIRGRITRKTYILRVLARWFVSFLVLLLFLAIAFVEGFLAEPGSFLFDTVFTAINFVLLSIFIIIYFIVTFAQEIKRLHDMNSSGLWLILRFIPLISMIYLLMLTFQDGTVGPNNYGDDPKNRIPEEPKKKKYPTVL